VNSQAPGFFRTTYTGVNGVHHLEMCLNLKSDWVQGEEPTVLQKDGTEIPAITGLGAFFVPYVEIFETETLFGLTEIYAVDAETKERKFVFAYNLDLAGTGASVSVPFSQGTMTFKTTKGGIIRLTEMEGVFPVNQKFRAPYTGIADLLALSNHMVSSSCVIYGRDNSYAFAPIATTVKTSDPLRERGGL